MPLSDTPLLRGYTTVRLDPTIYRVALSHNLRYVATGDNNKQIKIWEIDPDDASKFSVDKYEMAKPLDLLENGFHDGTVCGLAWAPGDNRLASSGSDHLILIWDIDFNVDTHQKPTRRLNRHTDWVTGLVWLSEERLLSGSRDSEIVCSNPETGDEILRFTNENKPVTCMTASPCGRYLAVGADDGVVRIYHWLSEKLIGQLKGHAYDIHSIAWSCNGEIAVASDSKEIKIWSGTDFKQMECKTLSGHKRSVLAVSFSPQGKLLASQGYDMTLRFWDVENGQPVDFKEWECSAHPNTGAGFDLLGKSILVTLGKKDHAFRVWKVSAEAMLKKYKQRSREDNDKYNRLEHGLIRTQDEQPTSTLNVMLHSAIEEAGFFPVLEGRQQPNQFCALAEENDFLVRVYSNSDELWNCHKDIGPFVRRQKNCYLFIAEDILEDSDYVDLSSAYSNLSEEQCVVNSFSSPEELGQKVIATLKRRFALTREEIDTRTELQNGLKQVDFAIVAATDKERRALCKAFDISPEERIRKGTHTYWCKRVPLPDEQNYYIIVAQCPDMANVNAALLVSDIVNDWEPKAILVAGIAAAVREEQALGDVVLGSSVYYYERGKVTADGTLPEPMVYNSDPVLLDRARSTSSEDFKVMAQPPDAANASPKIHVGAIASGEKVIDSEELRQDVVSHHRKIKAIEMEGYGVAAAAWNRDEPVRCLVIRAISDYADGKKNDDYQDYAAISAASFVRHYLLEQPLAPRNT